MIKNISVPRAKKEIERLQHYINLAESYTADTLEKKVVKLYAFHDSIPKVVKSLEEESIKVTAAFVKEVIVSQPMDDLHRLVRAGYMYKTKSSRAWKRQKGEWSK